MPLYRRKANNIGTKWSDEDTALLLTQLHGHGFNAEALLSLFPGRSLSSIRSKVRKLRIQHDIFGSSYRDTKTEFTGMVNQIVKPKVVFDAYAGAGHQTFKWAEIADKVFAAEIRTGKIDQFTAEAKLHGFQSNGISGNWNLFVNGDKKVYYFTGDTVQAAADLATNRVKIDLVDLDTCGSTLPTLPYFLLMLRPKHLVITHGEFHSMRFKREDVLRRLFMHRDINLNPLPLTVEEMSKELEKAVKVAALRAHNETVDSFWVELQNEIWLGSKLHGMLRRYFTVTRPPATADCLNLLAS